MDTNQNTANNYQINTFVKGMNSDTSYDMIGADQYLFGQNIRITNNTLLLGDQNPNFTEGVVTPVHIGEDKLLYKSVDTEIDRILATASIGDIGVVIIRTHDDENSYWEVILGSNRIFQYIYKDDETKLDTFSVVLHKEKNDVINLYIADGIHPVIQMNIADPDNISEDVDCLISGRLLPTNRFTLEKTSGRLKTQQVQYTYRLYKKHGTTTKLAPLTNKFNVIDPNRNKEQGNAEDTRTSIGLKLSLTLTDPKWKNYDHIQIYRISYIKQHEQPQAYLVYDEEYSYTDDTTSITTIDFVDKGDQELQQLSLDEFYALNSQIIIPQSIESNQGYLFAGNIQDKTTFYITDQLQNTAHTVSTYVPIDGTDEDAGRGSIGNNYTIAKYFQDCGVKVISAQTGPVAYNEDVSYNSIVGSSLLRSLRRDENYKYGVVYYNKYGATSNVIPIIGNPNSNSDDRYLINSGTSPITDKDDDVLYANPIGVECTIQIPQNKDIIGYQIVRCEKTDQYTKNILQVALSRPSRQSRYENSGSGQAVNPEYRTPYYPNIYLSTQFLYISYLTQQQIKDGIHDVWMSYFDYAGTNVENVSVYQAFAPEINILRKDTQSQLSLSTIGLNPIRFAYLDEELPKIAAMFESIPERLDKTGYIWVNFSSSSNPTYRDITDVINYTQLDETNTVLIYGSQTDYLNIQLFIPNGYDIKKIGWAPMSDPDDIDPADYEDVTSFVYDFGGPRKDDKCYVYYLVPGHVDPGECLVVKLEPRSETVGYHLEDVTEADDFYSSLDSRYSGKAQHQLVGDKTFLSIRSKLQEKKEDKAEHNVVLKLYSNENNSVNNDNTDIENVADVKNADWSQGFSSIQLGGDDTSVQSAIKQYKSFTSTVGNQQFVNWVANGTYDLAASQRESTTQLGNEGEAFVFHIQREDVNDIEKGWIGPGPLALLLNTKTPNNGSWLKEQIKKDGGSLFGTIVANINHTPLEYNHKYTQYYGFGNFRSVDSGATSSTTVVFDGDVYITPAEFTNLFKAYDFNDQKKTLMSGQTVYYIPMESRINTFFDYGMNYRNTSSTNLMLEPGEITGIASQARPLHQYNMIYSDNNASVDVFSPQIPEDVDLLNHIPHRICFSQLKTDGENIDNWQIFKPIDFIDVDSKYGDITHLLTSDNTLYYWQNTAFGKLSVNERSLVKDENSNAIQLGTGGVLNRYDYLSTRYGMRKDDRAAISAEHGIYWIDVNNKAIPACLENSVVNFSEICNVQNLVNQRIGDNIPTIDYDLQNYELLCNIEDGKQLVFNIKLRCATSIYTREYKKCIDINNKLLGINIVEHTLEYRQINYLSTEGNELLWPIVLQFAVNPSASLTKVYDNQKIVLMDGVEQTGVVDFPKKYPNYRDIPYPFLSDKSWEFKTDYNQSNMSPTAYRDTENNIWYAIPRTNSNDYGYRLRGKWMTTKITDNNPKEFAISHIITKFRQSYS